MHLSAACSHVRPLHPPLELLGYSAESRDRTGSQHDIQCSEPAAVARGQKCCWAQVGELPGMHSVPIASGVGGLSRRLLIRPGRSGPVRMHA